MIKKAVFLLFIFFFLGVLGTSFFVHFSFFRIYLNPLFWGMVLVNFFERPGKKLGYLTALFGGFFLDLFSPWHFGIITILFFLLAFSIKAFLKRYVRFSFTQRA